MKISKQLVAYAIGLGIVFMFFLCLYAGIKDDPGVVLRFLICFVFWVVFWFFIFAVRQTQDWK